MTEEEWEQAADPDSMIRSLPAGSGRRRKLRLFAAACCRTVFDWLPDQRSRSAVRVVELAADSLATDDELVAAGNRAGRAAAVVGGAPSRAVSWATVDRFSESDALMVAHHAALAFGDAGSPDWADARARLARLVRDVFGNPLRPATIDPLWRTTTAVGIAQGMYESRDFTPMPILADALEDAGCDSADLLAHCRGDGPHVRGCWVVDLVLGKA